MHTASVISVSVVYLAGMAATRYCFCRWKPLSGVDSDDPPAILFPIFWPLGLALSPFVVLIVGTIWAMQAVERLAVKHKHADRERARNIR